MSLKKNYLYQTAYQVLILCIPLLISPYLTRTLGAESIGVYTYSYSIAYVFFILGRLGIVDYGTREISLVKDDEEQLREKFWTLFWTHGIFSIVSSLIYIIVAVFASGDNTTVFLMQTLFVVSSLFDCTWLFFGLEQFKTVILKNVVVKLLELVFIFTFVKKPEDLMLYTVIMTVSYFTGHAIVFVQALHRFTPYKPKVQEIAVHMKPLLLLSISVIATSIYDMLDKSLLGILANTDYSGYYEYSDKIVKVPIHIICALGTVMLPRMTKLVKDDCVEELDRKLRFSFILVAFSAFAMAFGLAAVAEVFVPIYYGNSFAVCGSIIKHISPIIVFVTFSNLVRTQILLPRRRDRDYVIAVIMSAVINFTLNCCLIPYFGINGAIIGTLVAEGIACFMQCYFASKFCNIFSYLKEAVPFLLFGILMYFIVHNLVVPVLSVSLSSLVIEVFVGAIIYLICSFIYLGIFRKEVLKSIGSFVINIIRRK